MKVLSKCSFFHVHTANFLHLICRCKREKKFCFIGSSPPLFMIKVHPLLIKDVQKGRHSIIESNDDICQIFMLNIVVSNKQYLIIYVADSYFCPFFGSYNSLSVQTAMKNSRRHLHYYFFSCGNLCVIEEVASFVALCI